MGDSFANCDSLGLSIIIGLSDNGLMGELTELSERTITSAMLLSMTFFSLSIFFARSLMSAGTAIALTLDFSKLPTGIWALMRLWRLIIGDWFPGNSPTGAGLNTFAKEMGVEVFATGDVKLVDACE